MSHPSSRLLILVVMAATVLVAVGYVARGRTTTGIASPSRASTSTAELPPQPTVVARQVRATRPPAAPAGRSAGAGLPGLHTDGDHILNAQGQPLRLLGVNRSGSEFKCIQLGTPSSRGWGIFDGPTGVSSARSIASWHANVVRVPLNEDCWLGINGVSRQYGGKSYQTAVKSYVRALHQAGLYVILDLHWSAPGTVPAASQQPMPDLDHAPAFWQSVSRSFKRDLGVAFDLYNEPFLYTSYLRDPTENLWHCWLAGCVLNQYLTGGKPYTRGYTWRAAGMQTLVDTVRSTGARNLILVPGLDWANDVSQWYAHEPSDPVHNLAVSWHSYPAEGCADQQCWNRVVARLARMVPVVVGETGDNVCTAPTYDPRFLPWADRHGLSYLGWTWNPWQDCQNILIKGYAGIPTGGYGQYFHDHLLALTRSGAASTVPARPDRPRAG
jgi:aryl-phospho-beta-D-glucosidase BglC (GH1 family)